MAEAIEISLRKNGHLYILRYEEQCNVEANNALVDWVNNKATPFDWFDAALMCHEMGKRRAAMKSKNN